VPRLLAAPDKFRGTASAGEVAHAIATAARADGWDVDVVPVSDGGEGLLDCFGGANRSTTVTGPLGAPVDAAWRIDGERAVIEMATASGLGLVAANDPMSAGTRGTGQLIAAAIAAGARAVLVGAGGSASTDGGQGAVDVLRPHRPLDGSTGVGVVVATDVRIPFLDAATIFAPQKGADADQVEELTRRLVQLAEQYRREFGVDVRELPGAGAAGGLAGGLAALGARIRPGFEVVAETLGLAERVASADLVITGEGRFDRTSLLGKATGSLIRLCERLSTPVVIVAGQVAPGTPAPADIVDLTARFGAKQAIDHPGQCVEDAVHGILARHGR
jgi:glycerate 2-kinase